jgi:tetratricopeptide (TPR) repeat protein
MTAKLFSAIAISLTVSALTTLVGCGGAEERKTEHYQRAIRYFEQQNIEKAAIEFKNVIQIDPKVAKAYYYLGRIEEGKKNWREAFGLFQKAEELDPNDNEVRMKLAQFWLLANDANKATEMLEPVSKAKPTDIDVRLIQVAIANRKGETESALAQIEKIVAERPSRPEPYIVLAALYLQQGKPMDAEKTLRGGLVNMPNNPELLTSSLRFYQQQKQAGPAEEIVKQLIALQPERISHRVLLARIHMELVQYGEAEKVMRDAMRQFPGDPAPPLLLAEFFFKRGEPAKSENELKAAIAANKKEVKLRLALAEVLEQTKHGDQAEKVYRDFIGETDSKPDALKAKNAWAGLLARTGRTEESLKLTKEILAENAQDHDALSLQGRLALANGNAEEGIASFRSLLKDQPDSPEILTQLANAYLLDKKPGLAQENLEKASTAKPEDFGMLKNLVDFLIGQKDFTLALEKIDGFIKLQPNRMDGLILKANVLVASGNNELAEALLKQIKTAFPDNPLGPMRLGGIYRGQNRYEAAIGEYETALKLSKDAYEPLQNIAETYLILKQPQKALTRVNKAIAENPNNAGNHQVLASILIETNRGDEAEKALKDATKVNPNWLPPYINLGIYYEKQGKTEQAVDTYKKAAEIAPQELAIRFNLARIFESTNHYADAVEQYEKILQYSPGNLLAANNLASVLSLDATDRPKMDRALNLAKRLEHSGQPVFIDTLAWVYYQLGDMEKALPLQLIADEKSPNTPIYQYHLGMIYSKSGNPQRARELLTKAVQSGVNFPGLLEAKDALRGLESAR